MRSLLVQSLLALPLLANAVFAADPLPSWNDTAQKKAILTFVEQVTKEDSPDFVPTAERVATFDNDGTLWSEQPMYVQQAFMLDRIKALAPLHPEWKEKQPFKAVLEGDMKTVSAGGEQATIELVMASHAGNTTEEFEQIVKDWLVTAKHPKTGRTYTEMVYQPMLELLAYLRANGFKTFIVSGGGIEFMLQWTTAGSSASFALLVHHTDAERKWAYDRTSSDGRLDKALDEAQAKGWTVVDMKNDWKIIYAFEKK